MPQLRICEVSYHYRQQGNGPPLILLHGFTGSSESWQETAEILGESMTIVSIDLPGHGRTESPAAARRYAIDLVAQDIVALARSLGHDRFSILGYSMGGRLALYLTYRYPASVSSMILESASPGIADRNEREQRQLQDYALAESIEREGMKNFVDRWERLPLFATQSAVSEQKRKELREQRLQNNPLGLANSLRGMGTGSQPSLWNILPGIHIPTLLLCGELDDKYVSISKQMAERMRGADLYVVQDAGHNIHFEQPARFLRALSVFLQQPL